MFIGVADHLPTNLLQQVPSGASYDNQKGLDGV